MRMPSTRNRRALGLGLAALLAPAVVAGCGSVPAQRTSADAGRTTAAAVAHQGTPATGPTVSATTTLPAQRSTPPSPSATAPASGSGTPTATASADPSASAAAPSTSASAPTGGPSGAGHHGRIIRSTESGGRTVALTFDDGPGPATRPILDLLAQYHVHATFCQVGKEVERDPGAVRRIIAEGHRLCDHTVDHPQPMHTQSHDRQLHEVADARQAIVDAGGPGTQVTWFRAPGGDFEADNEQIAADHGMASLGWSVDPRDWSRPGVPAIVANIEQHVRPGAVVLMHDGGGDRSQTIAALQQLLPWLVSQGYTFDFPAAG